VVVAQGPQYLHLPRTRNQLVNPLEDSTQTLHFLRRYLKRFRVLDGVSQRITEANQSADCEIVGHQKQGGCATAHAQPIAALVLQTPCAMPKAAPIKKVAKLMRDLDFCMFTTLPGRGGTRSRPMSNNREVEFDGDVWFFSAAHSRKVRDITSNPNVQLSYVDLKGWRFISVTGKARIVRDAEKKQQLWMKELEQWFDEGPDSKDIVLIKVTPTVIAYWTRNAAGELRLK
jgi:general stress protein 26